MSQFKTSREIAADVQALISYEVTQRDVAKTLGISTAYLSDFLAGKREAGPAILKALGYDPTPFYGYVKALTIEQLDQLQFGRVLHERPQSPQETAND